MQGPGPIPIALNEQDKQVARMGSYIVWLEQKLATADQYIRELKTQLDNANMKLEAVEGIEDAKTKE